MTHYTALRNDDHDDDGRSRSKQIPTYRTVFVQLAILACAFATTFVIGFMWGQSTSQPTFTIPLSLLTRTFKYDRTFSYPPSNITNAAWESLFPHNGGFFSNPPFIPERVTLSVFHQLHCLDAIRHSYWHLHDAAIEGRKISDADFSMHTSPSHVRHCTDLLRQSIMCAGDRTIEHKDDKNGVSGFGTSHKCFDYRELVEKVESWQQ